MLLGHLRGSSAQWAHGVVGRSVTASDLPAEVRCGEGVAHLATRSGRLGSLCAGSLRVALVWQHRGVSYEGFLELTSLSRDVTQVDACLPARAGNGVAEAVIRAIAPSAPEPRLAPAEVGTRRRRRPRAAWAALAGATALAVAGAALHVTSPPDPVDLATAIDEFRRDASGPGAPRTGGLSRPARGPLGAATSAAPEAPGTRAGPTNAPAPTARTGNGPRRAPAAPAAQAPPRPAAGVYVYATRGGEEIDRPGGRHEYPAETHLTVRHAGCGLLLRWQPLADRWDETETCPSADPSLRRTASSRSFFGQTQVQDFACDPRALAWSPTPQRRWTNSCAASDAALTMRAQAGRREVLRVGGTEVETIRIRWSGELSGRSRGTWLSERWVDIRNGLLVRASTDVDVTSETAVGEVRYQEQVDLELVSLTPHR